MSCERIEAHLSDFVDGTAAPEVEESVRAHLEVCPGCRAALGELQGLLSAAANLPREFVPPRDLWPGIAPRLEPRVKAGHRARAWQWGGALAAAAALAVAAGSFLLPRTPARPAPAAAEAELRAAEAEFDRVRQDLNAVLDARRASLAPETAAVIDENLQLIDGAVREVRAALERDPGNRELLRQWLAVQRGETELLKRAAALAPEANGS